MEETEEYIILQDRDEEGNVGVFGLWIFSEPEPSSTARTRREAARVIADCAARAETTRAAAGSSDSDYGLGVDSGVPNSGQLLSKHQQGPIEITLSNPNLPTFPSELQPRQPSSTSPSQPEGGDILGDLFRKAGLNYRGL